MRILGASPSGLRARRPAGRPAPKIRAEGDAPYTTSAPNPVRTHSEMAAPRPPHRPATAMPPKR